MVRATPIPPQQVANQSGGQEQLSNQRAAGGANDRQPARDQPRCVFSPPAAPHLPTQLPAGGRTVQTDRGGLKVWLRRRSVRRLKYTPSVPCSTGTTNRYPTTVVAPPSLMAAIWVTPRPIAKAPTTATDVLCQYGNRPPRPFCCRAVMGTSIASGSVYRHCGLTIYRVCRDPIARVAALRGCVIPAPLLTQLPIRSQDRSLCLRTHSSSRDEEVVAAIVADGVTPHETVRCSCLGAPNRPSVRKSALEVSPVRPAGLEPATHGLEVRCSIQLSYER